MKTKTPADVLPSVLSQLNQTIQKVGRILKECPRCSSHFEIDDTFYTRTYPVVCGACNKAESESSKERERESLTLRWDSMCPEIFKSTNLDSLPNVRSTMKVLEWKFGPKGLLLHGETRTGKSRSAWLLLKRLHFERYSFMVLNSMAGLRYAALFGQSTNVVEEWINELISCDVLLMDDVFKIKLTDSFEGAIFSMVDQRSEMGRPMIVTANDTGETLKTRLTCDRSEPLLARFREFCDPIPF